MERQTAILLLIMGIVAITGCSLLLQWYILNELTPVQSIVDVLNVFSYTSDTWIPRLIAIWIGATITAVITKAAWEFINDKIEEFKDSIGL